MPAADPDSDDSSGTHSICPFVDTPDSCSYIFPDFVSDYRNPMVFSFCNVEKAGMATGHYILCFCQILAVASLILRLISIHLKNQ